MAVAAAVDPVIRILKALFDGGLELKKMEGDHLHNDDLSKIKHTIKGPDPVNLTFEFEEAGAARKLEGKRSLMGSGPHEVKLDGVVQPGARITFQPRLQGPRPRLTIRFVIKDEPNDHERFRFDADISGNLGGLI